MEKTGSGFYIIDAFSLRQASKKPFHLEKRFLNSGENDMATTTTSLEEAEIKREALLQERREKLSRKFLEVQQVVKQAQARKESQRRVFQQSLQLAELKRKTHIEQRRAASKELVERAKVIARQNSLRFEAEQARQRRALQDRLERSEARRLHMLSQPKSRILVTGTTPIASSHSRKKKKKPSSATSSSTTRCIIGVVTESDNGDGATLSRNVKAAVDKKATCDQHASSSSSKHQSMIGTTKKKKNDTWKNVRNVFYNLSLPWSTQASTWIPFNELVVLLRNRRVIQVIGKLLRMLLNETDKDKSRKWSRVLLSAYMMTICPCEVFQDMHAPQEQQLLAQAKQFLRQFELVLESNPEATPGSAARSHFEESWNAYYALFEAWKAKDMKQLVANMSSYCIELIRLKETLGQDDITVRQQLDDQIQQTKDRIRHVGGPSALEQLAETENAITSSTEQQQQQQPISVPPSPTPRPERLDSQQEQQQQQQQPMADDELKQMLSGYTHEGGISNHQLAHEIIIEPEFKLQKQSSALEDHIRKIATRAFFDRVAEDIKNGHSEESLPMLMDDVKQRLLNLLRQGTSVYNQVDEGIDIALITQEAKQNTFDLDRTLQYVVHIMSQICAPVRDEAIRAIGEMDDPVQRLRAILETLDEMALDLSNFRLRSLRPHLIPIAVEYERSKFAESLSNNTVGLARTRAWLQQAVRRMNEVATQRNPEGVPTPTPTLRADAVFEDAFITLLTSPQIIDATTCPETLAMDVDRMRVYQNEIQSITIVAALVMLAKNFGHTGDLNELTKKLFIMLQDPSTTIDNLASEIERTVQVSPERKPMIRAMVDKTVSHSDTVYSLLMRRVGSVIRGQLQSGKFATREVLLSYGLEYVRKPLESLSTRVAILGRHHRQVYATWYDDIIADEIKAISSS
ncbi:hypothetical protein LRAMOSA00241 [Lichtheimia ramosa]|uniref:T-complex protein 11-like protein 1 n=1 Tax=Lichtheimia ramosa TaxID=688394 RepID=A0A077W9R0_9FUNG|nr:hypothetical protein LRAMOSA00241 [Lichtheimia ramosa]